MYLFTFIPLIWRLEDLCLTLWFCLKEQRMNGIVLALFIYGLFFFYLWIYGLFWLPCSGVKEKVRNVVIGLVLEGKWDLLPLPDPLIFFFFLRFTREYVKICFLVQYIKKLNISELMVPNCALVPHIYIIHKYYIRILIYSMYLSKNTSWLHSERRPPNGLKSGFRKLLKKITI